jgi:predicted nucleotidyltransferase
MSTTTSTDILEEMTRRIVEQFHPQRIVLFGSRARGTQQSSSDYDLLIIAPSNEPRWRRTMPIYLELARLSLPRDVDAVWWTPDEVAAWRNVRTHFITTALREGKVLYEYTQ